MVVREPYRLPDDLLRWGWSMQQMKVGPRKHPGQWVQFIFWRWHGLAAGDDQLALDDPVRRVKVRRATVEQAFAEAVHQMREISATLTPGPNYQERYAAFGRLTDLHRRSLERFIASREPSAEGDGT